MADDDEFLIELADAVLDGRPLEWEAAHTNADASARALVAHFQSLAGIAAFHLRSPAVDDSTSLAAGSGAAPPPTWGPLTIGERIARGSFGDVYRAHDSRLDRPVALKLMRRSERGTDAVASTVVEEARLLARVRHPNVVTVYGAERIEGRVGLWMELVEGRTLEEEVRQRGPLPPAEVARIGVDLCRALGAVHTAGLLHRDLKAQNVMRDRDGRIVLMDFGAGRDALKERLTDVPESAGTPLYLAPELWLGAEATPQSEVYSLGVLLFHLGTGIYPTPGTTVEDVRRAHLKGERTRLRNARPDLPGQLVEPVERALSPDPARRFDSAQAFESALTQDATTPTRRRAIRVVVGAVAVLGVAGLAWQARQFRLEFHALDAALIIPFENRTGEPAFDGAIEAALTHEIANSPYGSVAPRGRIDDAVRLMKTPIDSPLVPALAREVCLSDGGIRVYISGRLERIGAGYGLSASLFDPADDRLVASLSEDAAGVDSLRLAIRRLSNQVRVKLGESRDAIQRSTEQLQKVTPPSFAALQLYSRSYDMGDRGQWPAALDLARQAVAEDPAFASAQIWLAWCLFRTEAPQDQIRTAAATALELAPQAMDWERYWIAASAHGFANEVDEEIAAYKALLAVHPVHDWAVNNLYNALARKGDSHDAIPYATMKSDRRPNDPGPAGLAVLILEVNGKFERARPYADRLMKLTRQLGYTPAVELARVLPVHIAYQRGDVAAAATALDRIATDVPGFHDPERSNAARLISFCYASLGQRRKAQHVADYITDGRLNQIRATIDFALGDTEALRSDLDQMIRMKPSPELVEWLVEVGRLQEAERQVESLEQTLGSFDKSMLPTLYGLVALRTKGVSAAMPILESRRRPTNPEWALRQGAYLADALVDRGEPRGAIAVLEDTLARKVDFTKVFKRMPLELSLAELYHQVGRTADARAIESDLSRRLAVADTDSPLLSQLKRLQAMP